MKTKLFIEFPWNVIINYHGVSNLDVTLDENITYLIGKYFYQKNIPFKILQLDFVDPKPNVYDQHIRYDVEIEIEETVFKYEWILTELERAGFEKGLTIRSHTKEIIYADQFSADIQWRRKSKKYS